jgi:hypothetical protein
VGRISFSVLRRFFRNPIASAPANQRTKRELLRFTRKRNLEARVRQNNPTGKSPKTLSSPLEKNIPLNPSGKSVL